jgi:hypothetical protein
MSEPPLGERLLVYALGLSGRRNPEFFGKQRTKPLVAAKSLSPVTGSQMGSHDQTMAPLAEGCDVDRFLGTNEGTYGVAGGDKRRSVAVQGPKTNGLQHLPAPRDPPSLVTGEQGPSGHSQGHRGVALSGGGIVNT